MKRYRQRIADQILAQKLEGKGAVLIEGPKWCGKTTTAEQAAKSILYLNAPQKASQYARLADLSPQLLLQGTAPRLIDEWQLIPKLWDTVRFEVDHRDELGQFILTGSAVPPATAEIKHTGTGRFAWLKMRPMSLYESGDSNGKVSLEKIFRSPQNITGSNSLDLKKLAFLVCRGGWPLATTLTSKKIALEQAFDYYDAVVNSDISRVDNVQRNPERVKRLMRAYARHQGTQAGIMTICKDMAANDHQLDTNTIASYINALKKIFVIEDMPAWNPNLRSKTAIRTSDTRYFVDPSIAVAALGIGPNDLINDLNTFGLLFETMCIRDLRVFAESLGGTVYHYRDASDLECDAVVHLRNGSYGLIEIKLGGDQLIDEGAKSLLNLANKIDTTKMKKPSFLMVLTGMGDFAYPRKDGVLVVPITCLRN